jgi:hypothetical protein
MASPSCLPARRSQSAEMQASTKSTRRALHGREHLSLAGDQGMGPPTRLGNGRDDPGVRQGPLHRVAAHSTSTTPWWQPRGYIRIATVNTIVAKINVDGLKEFGYFTYAVLGDQPVRLGDPRDYRIVYNNRALCLVLDASLCCAACGAARQGFDDSRLGSDLLHRLRIREDRPGEALRE